MGLTINGHYNYGLNITDAAALNPVSIGTSGVVTYTIGSALFLGGTVDWTLSNSGTVQSTGTGTASTGISLATGGVLSNTATGLIAGAYAGIRDTAAPVTLTNLGSIAATGTAGVAVLAGGGAIANAGGQITGGGTGIRLTSAGIVNNTGTIRGTAGIGVQSADDSGVGNYGTAALISGDTIGVTLGAASNVVNQGTIIAAGGTAGYTYSTVTHLITLQTGAVLLGSGNVTNAAGGTVSGAFVGVGISTGGTVVNGGSILTTGASTVTNFAVILQGGGAVTNAASGVIQSTKYGVFGFGAEAISILNQGTITSPGRAAVKLFGTANVTNTAAATISSSFVGVWEAAGGHLFNAGRVSGLYAVVFQVGAGTMENDATGVLSGARHGIYMSGAPGSVVNSGTILSAGQSGGAGIQLAAGGVATNAAGGYISAKWIGIQIGAGANNGTSASPGGTVVNSGTIIANDNGTAGAAVWIRGNGVILNNAGGTIAGGPYGVVSYDQVTVVNYGSIGGSQFAVFASNAGMHDRVVVHPGATFGGTVQGDKAGVATPTGTLELAAGTVSGAIAGFGSKYTGFSDVIVDAGAHWSLAGTVSAAQTLSLPGTEAGLTLVNPGSMAGTINGFDATDTLTLAGITDVTAATLGANNLLTVTESGGGTITLQFDPGQNFGVTSFGFAISGGSTSLTVACFASGTRLLAEHGPVPVEALRPGMMLRSAFGGCAPIEWIGHRRIDCTRHPRPHDVWPVRIHAGAFGPNMPEADLVLSPDHALHIDGVLIPVRYLVNGRTVVQERVASIAYWHVELPAHDVILAEGLPAETYLDTGNRTAFADADGPAMLHADFARAAWEQGGCAPLVLAGPEIAAARRRLLARAEGFGHLRTRLPALRVLAGGQVLPARIEGRRWTVALPEGAGRLRLVSRRWCPDETDPDGADSRVLGVALAALTLDGTAIDPARLGAGWHAREPDWRWTDGDAAILAGGARVLAFELAMTGRYWQDDVSAGAATAPRPRRRAGA